jgi:pimeloyl-ACP methyl ester carboxylesterase
MAKRGVRGWTGRAGSAFVALALAFAAAGPAAAHPKLRGELVDIGGRKLRLLCQGPKSEKPLILLEAGMFSGAASWDAVQTRLAARGLRSCAYDRAGEGFSDPGPAPRDADAIGSDFEAMLKASGETGPFVLVAHSLGGLEARRFAVRHPGEVRGLVLIDATSAELAGSHDGRVFLKSYGPFVTVAELASRLGVLRLMAPWLGDQEGLKGEAHDELIYFFGTRKEERASIQEVAAVYPRAKEVLAAGPLDPEIPVAAIILPHQTGEETAWSPARSAEARASHRGSVITLSGGDHPQLIGPRHADDVADAVQTVLDADAARRAARLAEIGR